MKLLAGKLPPELLRPLLASIAGGDPSVVVGGAVGEDAAVIDAGGPELLVAKTDPITLAGEDAGAYLLAVNSNDLATMGAEPRWLLVTALLPEGADANLPFKISESLKRACGKAAVSIVGGHTEITVGLDRPILVGCLLGTVRRDRLVRTAGARVGDAILLAGGIAIEGTAILAREHADALRAAGVEENVLAHAAGWLDEPGICVLPAARIINADGTVHSMHDPTEGGVVTALHELAEAASLGVRVSGDSIPVLPECRTICEALDIDPLGLLASGALLATLDPPEAEKALERLRRSGIPAGRIGEIVHPSEGRIITRGEFRENLPVFARDELARYLEKRRP